MTCYELIPAATALCDVLSSRVLCQSVRSVLQLLRYLRVRVLCQMSSCVLPTLTQPAAQGRPARCTPSIPQHLPMATTTGYQIGDNPTAEFCGLLLLVPGTRDSPAPITAGLEDRQKPTPGRPAVATDRRRQEIAGRRPPPSNTHVDGRRRRREGRPAPTRRRPTRRAAGQSAQRNPPGVGAPRTRRNALGQPTDSRRFEASTAH